MKDEGCEYVSSIENAQGETLASLVYWILRNSLTFSPFFSPIYILATILREIFLHPLIGIFFLPNCRPSSRQLDNE